MLTHGHALRYRAVLPAHLRFDLKLMQSYQPAAAAAAEPEHRIVSNNESNDGYVYGYRISLVPVQFTDGVIAGNVAHDMVRDKKHEHVLVKVGFSQSLDGVADRFGKATQAWNRAGIALQLPSKINLRSAAYRDVNEALLLRDTTQLRRHFADLLFIVPAPLSAEVPLRWAIGRPIDKKFIRSLQVELQNEFMGQLIDFASYAEKNMAPTEYVVSTRVHASRVRRAVNHSLLRAATVMQLPRAAHQEAAFDTVHHSNSHFFTDIPAFDLKETWPGELTVKWNNTRLYLDKHHAGSSTVHCCLVSNRRIVSSLCLCALGAVAYRCQICGNAGEGIFYKSEGNLQAAHPDCAHAFERGHCL